MASKKHKDVQFEVQGHPPYDTFTEAAGQAVSSAVIRGKDVFLDVVVHSRAGARWWRGEDGVDDYDEDPEASVFERIRIRADDQGRVP